MTSRRDFLKMGAFLTVGGIGGAGLTGLAHAVEPVARQGKPVIKVGCAAYSYRKYMGNEMNLESFLDVMAELGVDGVEMTSYYFPKEVTAEYINGLKRKAYLLGLAIPSTSVGNRFTFPPGEERDAQIALVKKWVNHAAEMGAPAIRVFAGGAPKGTEEDEAIGWVVECLNECSALAAEKGVMLALENHGGVTSNADQVLKILKSVESDWVGLLLDTGNFGTADPYEDIRKVAPYAITTHFKVEVRPAGREREKADLARITSILRDVGFRGYLILEYEAAEDPKTGVPKIIEEMKKHCG